MKAAVWHGAKDIRVEDVDLKPTKDNEVVVKVAWTGICGSDLHEYQEGPIFIPVGHKDKLTGGEAPVTLGHEFCGVIEKVGKDVTKFKVGDHVSVNPTVTHGKVPDNVDVYDGYSFIGLACDGGLAPLVNIPEENLYLLPKDFPLRIAATIEPTAAAKAAGASKIIVSDLSEVRLKKALEMGATDVIKSDQEDAVKKIKELVPGRVDVSFEVAGVKPTFDQAIEATKARGTMVIVAIYGHPIEFNPMQLTNTGVKITSTIAYSRETFQQTVDLVTKGSLVVEPVITKEITIDQVVSDGFEALTNDKAQAKILINVDGEDD